MVTSMLSEEHIPSRGILWDFKRHVAPRLIKLCCPNASVQLGRKDQYEAERRNFVDLCQHHPPTKVGHCSWSLLTCGEDLKCAAQQHLPHCTIAPNQFVSGRMGDRLAFAGNLTDAPLPERIKQSKGGAHDNCWAGFSICRRSVLSLVCRDCAVLFCREVAIRLLG